MGRFRDDTIATPTEAALREELLQPLIAATHTALGQMAGTETECSDNLPRLENEVSPFASVVLELQSEKLHSLILTFPEVLAVELTRRILAGTAHEIDATLVHDCLGEIGNVVAGQAKTLLARSPFRFTFSTPRVHICPALDQSSETGAFFRTLRLSCDAGAFTLTVVFHPASTVCGREPKSV